MLVMTRCRAGAVVLALAVSLAALPGLGSATSHADLFSEGAHAFFASTDPSGCVQTTVDLFGFRQRSQPTPPNLGDWEERVEFFVEQTNTCTGERSIAASESGPPARFRLQVNGRLASAKLDAVVPAHDHATGTDVTVKFQLTWDATGDTTTTVDSPEAGVTRTTSTRDAQASGHVSLGTTDLTPGGRSTSGALSRVLLGTRVGADLVVRKTADRRTARVGDSVTYTISLTNRGPETATDVLVEEGAPDELGVTAFDCGVGQPVPQSAFACHYDSLTKGETVTATFVATITPDAGVGERVTNTASVAGSSAPDPNHRNDAGSATVTIVE